jgi:sulfatase modifying factor 1
MEKRMQRFFLLFSLVVSCSLINPFQETQAEPAGDNNSDLLSLTVSSGTLIPAFAPGITTYNLNLPNGSTSVTVTGTQSDSEATVSLNNGVAQGLSVGTNPITITVTAKNGSTTKDYLVVVDRAGDYSSANIGTLKYVPDGRFQRDGTGENISAISQPYRIGQYEITRAQFLAIMGTDPSDPTYTGSTNDPVQNLSWYSAIAFCNKLSLTEGLTPVYTVSGISDWGSLDFASIPISNNATWNEATADWSANGYRLPTEMEWMWAAMGAPSDGQDGGINTTGYLKDFSGSNGVNSIGDYAVFGYGGGTETGRTTNERSNPVGSKLPNELSLYDMSGNVLERCWDWEAGYLTGTLTDYRGPESGSERIIRGGGWFFGSVTCTVARRSGTTPNFRTSYTGLRVVRN